MTPGLRALLGKLTAFRVKDWGPDSAEMAPGDDREEVTNLNDAHVVSSLMNPQPEENPLLAIFDTLDGKDPVGTGPKHVFMIDVDHPVHVVDSSTPGHHHIYIEVPGGVSDSLYWPAVRALADAGVIEKGYARVSEERGHTDLRLPWIHKLMHDEEVAAAAAPLPKSDSITTEDLRF